MRGLGWLLLLAANGFGFVAITYPAIRDRGAVAERGNHLAEEISRKEQEVERWEKIAGWVERARPVLDELYGAKETFLPRLRQTLLSLEKGLSVRRSLTEYRPEAGTESGFTASRIRVVLQGDFSNLHAYLERAARTPTPLAPTEMSLVEDPAGLSGGELLLSVSFLALWPK